MKYKSKDDIRKADELFCMKLDQLRACCKSMHALSLKCGIPEGTLYELKRNPYKLRICQLRKLIPWFVHFNISFDLNEVI